MFSSNRQTEKSQTQKLGSAAFADAEVIASNYYYEDGAEQAEAYLDIFNRKVVSVRDKFER